MNARVNVLFFASLREEVGMGELQITAAHTGEVLGVLAAHLSAEAMTALGRDNVRMAVNQQLVESDQPLQSGDEVAFLPPVTGG